MIHFALGSFTLCIGVIDIRHSDKTKGRKLNIISTVFLTIREIPLLAWLFIGNVKRDVRMDNTVY